MTSALRQVVLQLVEDFSRPFHDGTGAPHGNLEPPTIVGLPALISHENPRSSADATDPIATKPLPAWSAEITTTGTPYLSAADSS
jgi:hypothetical protein